MRAHQVDVLGPILRVWTEFTDKDVEVKGTVDSKVLKVQIDKPFATMEQIEIELGKVARSDDEASFTVRRTLCESDCQLSYFCALQVNSGLLLTAHFNCQVPHHVCFLQGFFRDRRKGFHVSGAIEINDPSGHVILQPFFVALFHEFGWYFRITVSKVEDTVPLVHIR